MMMRLRKMLATGTAALLLASGGVALSTATAPPAEAAGIVRTYYVGSQYGKESVLSACRIMQNQIHKQGLKITRQCYYTGYYYDATYRRYIYTARFQFQTNAW